MANPSNNLRVSDFPIGRNLYSFDNYIDAKYGKSGSPSRERFEDEAFQSVKEMVGEEEFYKMMEGVYA